MNWEIITFLGYFVILLGVALIFYFNGSNKNSEDFFLGGRSMGPWSRPGRHRPPICLHGC